MGQRVPHGHQAKHRGLTTAGSPYATAPNASTPDSGVLAVEMGLRSKRFKGARSGKRSRTKRQRRTSNTKGCGRRECTSRAAAISNSPRVSSSSGKSPGSVQSSRSSGGGSGGNQSQKKAAGRKGGKKSSSSRNRRPLAVFLARTRSWW
jgi:hypothetical protein